MGQALVRVAGVTFNNEDGSSRQEILTRMRKGRKLQFRDAAFEGHPNAISVHNLKGEQLGFLESAVSEYIRNRSIEPSDLSGVVFSIAKNKEGSAYGCLIFIDHENIESAAINYQPEQKNNSRSQNSTSKGNDAFERQIMRNREESYQNHSSGQSGSSHQTFIGCLPWIFIFIVAVYMIVDALR